MKTIGTVVLAAAALCGGAARSECRMGKVLDMPVTMAGLSPTVTIQLDGKDARFIADSGAFYSMISPGSAAELGLRLTDAPAGFFVSGIGGDQMVRLTTVKALGLGKYTLPNVQFLVGGSEVGEVGLLGQNVLGAADVEYDLSGGSIRIMRVQGCQRVNLAYWIKPGENYSILPIEAQPENPLDRRTAGVISVNGTKLIAEFDTGAGVSMMTVTAARHAGIRIDGPGVVASTQSGGIGRRLVRTWIAPVADLKIGDEEIKNTHVRISDVPNAPYDMLIGADFFLSHHVYVSNANQKIYFSYGGGPVFNLTINPKEGADAEPSTAALPVPTGPMPTDAQGFARRASVFAARRDYDHALDDLDHAVALAPAAPDYLVQRARMHMAKRQQFLAMNDLDAALKLKGNDPEALLTRAEMRLQGHDKDGARADLEAADRAAPSASNLRLAIGSLYEEVDDLPAAISALDQWIKVHPDDSSLPVALNDRCWMRALAGRELPKAVADCNAALRARPKTASFLDSLGLAQLRSGSLDAAMSTYNQALAINNKLAWSLYGRGLIKLKKGDKAGGEADIAAANALDSSVAEKARHYGFAS